jgi:hypothetical protein
MLRVFIFFVFLCSAYTQQKGTAWKTWQRFTAAVKNKNMANARRFVSGGWAEELKINDSHLTLLAWELSKNPVSFVREFRKGDKYFLVLKSRVCPITLTFIEKDGAFTIDDWVAKELPMTAQTVIKEDVGNALVKIKLAGVRLKLRGIGKEVRNYFQKQREKIYPDFKNFAINFESMTFIHPETSKKRKIIPILSGYTFVGQGNYIIAITDCTIAGKIYAVFEDGHVRGISPNYLDIIKNNFALTQPGNPQHIKYVEDLAHKDRKVRATAKKDIIALGLEIAPFLRSQLSNKDPEVKMSVKEILKEFETYKRPVRIGAYENKNPPKVLCAQFGKYLLLGSEKYFIAVKLREIPGAKSSAKYEATLFPKNNMKSLKTFKGEVFEPFKRGGPRNMYIKCDEISIKWSSSNGIYFGSDIHAMAVTNFKDISKVDFKSDKLIWIRNEQQKASITDKQQNLSSLDIFVLVDSYVYQGAKKTLDEMSRTLKGIGAAMGEDVIINVKVSKKVVHKRVALLLDSLNKAGLTNVKLLNVDKD